RGPPRPVGGQDWFDNRRVAVALEKRSGLRLRQRETDEAVVLVWTLSNVVGEHRSQRSVHRHRLTIERIWRRLEIGGGIEEAGSRSPAEPGDICFSTCNQIVNRVGEFQERAHRGTLRRDQQWFIGEEWRRAADRNASSRCGRCSSGRLKS